VGALLILPAVNLLAKDPMFMNVEEFYKSITGSAKHAEDNVQVFYTYKGMPVNEQFIYEYPEFYPSQEEIDEMCDGLKNKNKGSVASFTVTERGFEEIRPVAY
jgi:hypothetical protein